MEIKNYYAYEYMNKGRITRKRCMKPICLKFFIILLFVLLCFRLYCLFEKEHPPIFLEKFYINNLRILAEKKLEDANKCTYVDESWEQYNIHFNNVKRSIISTAYKEWDLMCLNRKIKVSVLGREWEKEKFIMFYEKIERDINEVFSRDLQHYCNFKESSPTYKKLSTFIDRKIRDLSMFETEIEMWIIAQIEEISYQWELYKLENEMKALKNRKYYMHLLIMNNNGSDDTKSLLSQDEYYE